MYAYTLLLLIEPILYNGMDDSFGSWSGIGLVYNSNVDSEFLNAGLHPLAEINLNPPLEIIHKPVFCNHNPLIYLVQSLTTLTFGSQGPEAPSTKTKVPGIYRKQMWKMGIIESKIMENQISTAEDIVCTRPKHAVTETGPQVVPATLI